MSIIVIENRDIGKFATEHQRQLREALGHSEAWNGIVDTASELAAVYGTCSQNAEVVLDLITLEYPTEITTRPTVVLERDDYLGSFIFKSKFDQKDLDLGMAIAIHRVYTRFNATVRTATYFKAMGLELVSSQGYGALKESVKGLEGMLSSIASTWPPLGDGRYHGRVSALVDRVTCAQDLKFKEQLDNMATLEKRINAMKEVSAQIEQRLNVLDPLFANSDAFLNKIRDLVIDRLAELSKDGVKDAADKQFIADTVAEVLSPGTALFNELLENFASFLEGNKEFRALLATEVKARIADAGGVEGHAD